jgi:DNA-binding response OmpR family regulator
MTSSPARSGLVTRATGQTILVCEDEASIRGVIVEVLKRHGFRVHATGSPREALEIGRRLGARLDLLVTDVIMPDLNGPQLATALSAELQQLEVLYMSGYTAGLLHDLGIHETHDRLLTKPFSPTHLLERVTVILRASAEKRMAR